jgi:hypothetical protein
MTLLLFLTFFTGCFFTGYFAGLTTIFHFEKVQRRKNKLIRKLNRAVAQNPKPSLE